MLKNKKDMAHAVYFKSLSIEKVRCFRQEQTIDLSDNKNKPAQWTVILGKNNTGKTTLLKCLATLEAKRKIGPHGTFHSTPKASNNDFPSESMLNAPFFTIESRLFLKRNNIFLIHKHKWAYHNDYKGGGYLASMVHLPILENLIIYGYGTNRKINPSSKITTNKSNDNTIFSSDNLINPEEWLIQTDYAVKNGIKKAIQRLGKIKQVLIDILPDVQDFRFQTDEQTFNSYVEVKTDYGWVRINELGYGYQSLMVWVVDLAKKMFERYPNSLQPLAEPAIVLVDEIDLHLHPEWQRKIISWLSKHFAATQFIVTAHSPLIIQSADNINVVLLKQSGNEVKIEQPNISTFKGWTVEEILSDLMDLNNRTHSEAYLTLIHQFDEALDEDNYIKAKSAYDQLDKILHPTSPQRKLLRLQMTALTPLEPITI